MSIKSEVIKRVVNGKLRLLDIAEMGAEACNELEAYYELYNKGSKVNTQKIRRAQKAFITAYRKIRKIYYNV